MCVVIDTTHHNIFFEKFDFFGFRGKINNFLNSYVSGKEQWIQIVYTFNRMEKGSEYRNRFSAEFTRLI